MFFKLVALRNSAIFTGKHLCWSIFIYVASFKTDFNTGGSCKYYEIFTNSFFYKTPPVVAFGEREALMVSVIVNEKTVKKFLFMLI